jgi:hypothetical protein
MTRPTRPDEVWSIDDLELELRKLPGVRAAGFDEYDDMLLVQLHVTDHVEHAGRSDRADQPVPIAASRIAARHSDRPVSVEVVRWRNAPVIAAPLVPVAETETETETEIEIEIVATEAEPASFEDVEESGVTATPASRARLLAVLAFPDTDELEVHLVLDGKRTIGRAPASQGIEGAVAATIAAVRELGPDVNARIRWAQALDDTDDDDDQVVVAVSLDSVDERSPAQYGLAAGNSAIDAAARATLDALNRALTRTD